MNRFQKAVKYVSRLHLALVGIAGSGKTYTAIKTACAIAKSIGGRVAVIDTNRGKARMYADEFDFDVLELDTFAPEAYVRAVRDAERDGYQVVVVDGLSQAWMGKGGILEQLDAIVQRTKATDTGPAWRELTPRHNAMIDALLASDVHLIVTLRSESEWIHDKREDGRHITKRIGTTPIQRKNLDYEFDVVGELDDTHTLLITKSLNPVLVDAVIPRPGEELAWALVEWLGDGEVLIEPDLETLRSDMDAAEDEAALRALAPTLKRLRGAALEDARKHFGVRLELLRKRAAAAAKPTKSSVAASAAA